MRDQLLDIPISLIDPNPEQPRRHFDPASLAELAQSIAQHGIIQPLVVEQRGERYILHAGERRLRAAELACLAAVPCVVAADKFDANQRLERALVENIMREDMRPSEEAEALAKLRDRLGLTVQELARRVGKSGMFVTGRLQLLQLEPEIRQLIDAGELPHSERPVKALLSVPAGAARIGLAQRSAAVKSGISAIENACRRVNESLAAAVSNGNGTPALALSGAAQAVPRVTPRWGLVRAAAGGTCAECNSNPGLPEPAWSVFVHAAGAECGGCAISEMARRGDLTVCQDCPAVGLLRRVAVAAGGEVKV